MSVITTSTSCPSVAQPSAPAQTIAKSAKMYNLNVNVNAGPGNNIINNLLAVESACTTPRTPEILNSLMAMSNPLDDFNYNASEKCATGGPRSRSGNDSNSNSSGSPLGSPASSSTPSVQKTCSQLIKAGLKLSIETKRKMSGSEAGDPPISSKRLKKEEASDDDYDDLYLGRRGDRLTPEDEERRRRRRERNKIAATKCRLKKRERTVNLVSESETLETQNIDLKSQIQELEVQRRQLSEMLSQHSASCLKNNTNTSSPTTPYNPIQPPYDSPTNYPGSTTPYEPNSPYIRPESANVLASSYNCDIENPPSNYNQPVDTLDIGTPYSSIGTPTSEGNYMRQDDTGYVTSDNYAKNVNLLVENSESVYIEIPPFENQDMNGYHYSNHTPSVSTAQQCHNVNSGETRRNKFRNTGIDNGCMA